VNIKKELDQFYTNQKTALKCFNYIKKILNLNDYFLFEPSAGTGAFSMLFHKNSLSIDIDPKSIDIKKEDYLLFDISYFEKKSPILTIGNPPFGKNSSLAIKFFNKSAKFSNFVCFIVPKTFKKDSVINKLDKNMFLVSELELDKNSFIFNNSAYNVPCVFQVWEKRETIRPKIEIKKNTELFTFTKKEEADFAIRRVGGLAGKVIISFDEYSKQSHYFIKINKQIINKSDLIKKLQGLYRIFNDTAKNSAGNPSLSKNELIKICEKNIKLY
jgi:predicted RNA methylase